MTTDTEMNSLEWRVKNLEEIFAHYKPHLEEMITEREVNKRVAIAVKNERRVYLTWTQRMGALTIFVIAILNFGHAYLW